MINQWIDQNFVGNISANIQWPELKRSSLKIKSPNAHSRQRKSKCMSQVSAPKQFRSTLKFH